jgi:putative ABC transport system permease protein
MKWWRTRKDEELDAEIQSHLEMAQRDRMEHGETAEQACAAVQREFGNVGLVKEVTRQMWGWVWLERLIQDLRFGLRMLRKNPGFTLIAILTLALGIGACTAMFSIVNAVLLRPLPFREPERLVWIQNSLPGATLSDQTMRVDNFLDWRVQAKSFEALAAYNPFFEQNRYSLTGVDESQRLRGIQVSQNFLEVLGVQPALGRNFVAEECVWKGRRAAILSHAFWQQKFDGTADVVGRSVTVNGEMVEIVGVLPASAHLDALFSPGTNLELLLPLPLTAETFRWGNLLFGIGRLKPTVTIAQAQEELAVINTRLQASYPERVKQNGNFGASVNQLEDHIRGPFRPAFFILAGPVLCVLLIVCVNLSNLLLARATARRQEFSIRIALGASRWHLVRQTMTESVLLAFIGGALGVFVAYLAAAPLANLQAFSIPLLHTTSIDALALVVTVSLTTLAGCLCGVLPALQLWRHDAHNALNATNMRGGTSRDAARMRQSLVIAEIALACVLLVGAGLLVRSFVAVLQVDLGFQPAQTFAWRVDTARRFNAYAERVLFYDRLVERISAIPGIELVGLSDSVPLGYKRAWSVRANGATEERDVFVRIVDQRGLQTMRVPLRAGRYFDDHDLGNAPRVFIISETTARILWPGQTPIGQTATLNNHEYTVVGVVADVVHGLEAAPQPDMYLNFHQSNDWQHPELIVRANHPPASLISNVRAAIKEFDPALASNEFTPLDQVVDQAIAPRQLITGILSSFSVLALLLATIGLYGVIAYSVTQRTKEIGIRLALGAQRGDVVRLVVGEGLRLGGVGIAVGLVGAFFVTQVMQNQLHGVVASDPFTYVLIATILGSVAILAAWLPARRATKVDPLIALRHE